MRQSEWDFLPEELSEMHRARQTQEYPLGDLPLIVLTRPGHGHFSGCWLLSPCRGRRAKGRACICWIGLREAFEEERYARYVKALRQRAKAFPEGGMDQLAALEAGFRFMRRQFPGRPEVYDELIRIAERLPADRGRALARDILDWPTPAEVKERARRRLEDSTSEGETW
jgi:hypothetical protein